MSDDLKALTNEQLKPYIDATLAERRRAAKNTRRDLVLTAVGIITYWALLSTGIISAHLILTGLLG